MDGQSIYREKYLKYKSKYMELKKYRLNGPILNMKGGALSLVLVEQIPKIHDIEGDGEIEAYERYEQFKEQVDTLKHNSRLIKPL